MNQKIVLQTVGVSITLVALVFGLSAIIERNQGAQKNSQEILQGGTISLTIENLYAAKEVSISSDETVLEILQTRDVQDPAVRLITKEYSGLGVLVESMNGKTNGADNEYWQYTVNGVMPQIGADAYKLSSGDSVEWYFGASEF